MTRCECGCGGYTNGGSFIPGHDAKLKAELLKRWREWDDGHALDELRDRGWIADFDSTRTFGVEIEFLVTTTAKLNRLISEIQDRGLDCEIEGYNHRTRNHWKIVTDVSVKKRGWIGRELVSPILKGKDGLRQIELVCEALKAVGATVNVKCGIHVHHGIKTLKLKDIKTLYHLYIENQHEIDRMVAGSRRTTSCNTYCGNIEDYRGRVQRANSIQDLQNRLIDRYRVLNFCSYVKYGTVEFRQHQGTIDAKKIIEWVKFGQAMIKAAKRGVSGNFLENQLEMSKGQVEYWTQRKYQLAS